MLFDLGQTLIHFDKVNTRALSHEAATNAYDYLKELDQPVGGFKAYKWSNLLSIRLKLLISDLMKHDWDSLVGLRKSHEKKGIRLSPEQWRQLNWKWYEPLSKRGSIEPDLAETLGLLRDKDIKLGIVSNTWVNGCSLEKHLDKYDLLHFFDVRVYSHDYPFRKPDKRIFLEAAKLVDVPCANILFIGDRIDNDIKGAIRAGMIPILKTTDKNKQKPLPPTATRIDKLSEIPKLIEKLNAD